jgi:flavodoxin/ferredoxin
LLDLGRALKQERAMKAFGRRQFLQAVTGSAALWSFRNLFSQNAPGTGSGPGAGGGKAGKPLKAVIVYYSATGSTFKVAKSICQGLRKTMSCDLLKIKKADPKKMAQYDLIGIGGPIWYYRDTANLKLFLNKVPSMEGKPAFLFCTHGSEPIGFFDSLGQSVMKKKMTIIGWNDWYGSVFHVLHMPKPYLTDGHPDAIDLAQAEAFGDEMADRARSFYAGDLSAIPDVPQGPGADPLWIRRDISESQRGPGPKVGSAYGDGVDPAVAAKAKLQIPGTKPAATAKPAAAGGAAAMAVGAFGDIGTGPKAGASQAGSGGPAAASRGAGARKGGASGSPGGPGGAEGGGPPGGIEFSQMAKVFPKIDLKKCVYPRCDACIFGCPVNAIDLSLATPGGAAGSRLAIKEACVSCDLCERMCAYDAMVYEAKFMPKTIHQYDMKKCTYPQCTLCVDNCLMNCIDFATRPPTIHTNCEGCDVCWCVCPHDAISIPNLAQNQMLLRMSGPNHPFVRAIEKYEAAGRFRRLVPVDKLGFDHPVFLNKNAPRVLLNENEEATYCDTPCKVEKFHAS